jgi:hypothetical protein
MKQFQIDEKKLIKLRLNFYNVNEKLIPNIDQLMVRARDYSATHFAKDPKFTRPKEEQLGIMCNQYLGKMIFQIKRSFRYLSLSSKKGLTMRLSEISTLFRKVFEELLCNIEVFPLFDETMSQAVMLKCVNKVSYPFSADDFKKLHKVNAKYFGYRLENVLYSSEFVDYDSLYIAKVNCGNWICDMRQDEAKYEEIAQKIASYLYTIQKMEMKRKVKNLKGYKTMRYFVFYTLSKA